MIGLGDLQEFASEIKVLHIERVGEDRYAGVLKMLYTHAIIVGKIGDKAYDDRWCYETVLDAAVALEEWKIREFADEPQWWHRHPTSGRRRPHGDASREYINP